MHAEKKSDLVELALDLQGERLEVVRRPGRHLSSATLAGIGNRRPRSNLKLRRGYDLEEESPFFLPLFSRLLKRWYQSSPSTCASPSTCTAGGRAEAGGGLVRM